MSVDYNDSHSLVDHLMTYRKPETPTVVDSMDLVRGLYINLGHNLADELPPGPEKTIAIRKLHEALMAAIACLALNQ